MNIPSEAEVDIACDEVIVDLRRPVSPAERRCLAALRAACFDVEPVLEWLNGDGRKLLDEFRADPGVDAISRGAVACFVIDRALLPFDPDGYFMEAVSPEALRGRAATIAELRSAICRWLGFNGCDQMSAKDRRMISRACAMAWQPNWRAVEVIAEVASSHGRSRQRPKRQ